MGALSFFIPTNRGLALLSGWFRLAYAAVLTAALFDLVSVMRLTQSAGYLSAFDAPQTEALVMWRLQAFADNWAVGLLLFAVHLFCLGLVAYRSGYAPKWLGILLIAASISYLIDNVGRLLVPNYLSYEALVNLLIVPSFLGETLFFVWLIFWGRRIDASTSAAMQSGKTPA